MKYSSTLKWILKIASSCFTFLAMTAGIAYADTLTLDKAISTALSNNPSYQAMQEETKAAKARIPQAYTPENPQFELEFEKTPINTLNVEDAMYINYKVRQNIPFPGKLVSRGAAAKNEWRAAKEIQKQTALNLASGVKKTFFNIILVGKKLEIEKKNKELFQKYTKIAETKYATGQAPFDDPVKASIEASDFENILSGLTQEKANLLAELSYLMGEKISEETVLTAPTPSYFDKKLEDIKDTALKNQPGLKAISNIKDVSKNRLNLAKQQYIPDIMTEFGYNQGGNNIQNAWTASFGISVPLWFLGRQAPAVREAKAMSNSAVKSYENAYNKLNAEIIGTYQKIKSSERIIDIYKKTILPKAEANLKSAETSYVTGRADFLNLVDSARKWKEYQIDYWQARTDYENAIAEMETLVGKEL